MAGMVRARTTLAKFEYQQMTFSKVAYSSQNPEQNQLVVKPANSTTSNNSQIFNQLK